MLNVFITIVLSRAAQDGADVVVGRSDADVLAAAGHAAARERKSQTCVLKKGTANSGQSNTLKAAKRYKKVTRRQFEEKIASRYMAAGKSQLTLYLINLCRMWATNTKKIHLLIQVQVGEYGVP